MNDWDHILRAILDEPDNDTHRLAAADWLEEFATSEVVPCPRCTPHRDDPCPECDGRRVPCFTCRGTGKFPPGYHPERDVASGRHDGGWANCKLCNDRITAGPGLIRRSDGRAERAEFIRLQLHIDRMESRDKVFGRSRGELIMRARELLHGGWREFGAGSAYVAWTGPPLNDQNHFHDAKYTYRRGFVSEVNCRLGDWQAHGKAVVNRHPIGNVTIRDRSPLRHRGALREVYTWVGGDGNHWSLPSGLFFLLDWSGTLPSDHSHGYTGWASPDAAANALSDALLKHARNRCQKSDSPTTSTC